jgi:hypothetical protein
MAFKLTYRDGQDDDYDDSTLWVVEAGVLKMGHEEGNWTVLVSPSHWATIEVKTDKAPPKDQAEDKEDDGAEDDEGREQDEKDEGHGTDR